MRLDSATSSFLLLKRKSLRRELSAREGLTPVRVAFLGGSTTNEVADFLELLLLDSGFRPEIWQSDFNRYYEEAVVSPEALIAFRPDVAIVHTSFLNLRSFPPLSASLAELSRAVSDEIGRYQAIWSALHEKIGCAVVQNNFEAPPSGVLGNLDAVGNGGRARFVNELNLELSRAAQRTKRLHLQDVHTLSSRMGLSRWFDWQRWYSYKIHTSADASLALARSLAAIVRALFGRSKKCLVLDLDNTLWGGVIGDDGPENIKIGRETPEAEAYTAFQEYCLSLRERGVLLAVCSKNDEEVAKKGFSHPDSVLKLSHLSAFRANWQPKPDNILSIAEELSLGVDSFVFVDDNPAERALVAAQLPMVAVPDVGSDPAEYIPILEAGHHFETVGLSTEDLMRAEQYAANAQRASVQSKFATYGEYLDSLGMTAEIGAFRPEYLERITQLTNKTNQFNLTTRRCTRAEIESFAADPGHLALYGRLTDVFGDNGLITVVVGEKEGADLHLILWLMSCRVLKRDMEIAMLDVLVEKARSMGVSRLIGRYFKTAKNGMVADHYERLGFSRTSHDPVTEASVWALDTAGYTARNKHISIKGPAS